MAETHPADPLRDVHTPQFWDHSIGHLEPDLARVIEVANNLAPTSPEAIALRGLTAFVVEVIKHQELTLRQVALDTAPPLPKPPRKPRAMRQPKPIITQDASSE